MRNLKLLTTTLFVSALCAGTSFAASSQKTFLAVRPAGVNGAMASTLHHDCALKNENNKTHTYLSATGFYQGSTNGKDLGKYFGVGNNSNSFSAGDSSSDVETAFLVHQQGNSPSAVITLKPKQEVWGLRLDWFQDICHNFFLKVNAPIVNATTSMGLKQADSVTVDFTTPAVEYSVADFFAGNVEVTATTLPNGSVNLQSPLSKAKMGGNHSKTGLADIDVMLGYKILHKKSYHLSANFGVTIPTGNKSKGNFVFEPMVGNGGHVGLGAGLDFGGKVWESDASSLVLSGNANYRYLLKDSETRTLGIKSTWFTNSPVLAYAQYSLLGKQGVTGGSLVPAANLLTQKVNVERGSQLDGVALMSFKTHGFVFDLGYNVFWKERENVNVKSWNDGVYGIALSSFDTATAFDTIVNTYNELPINSADLDTNAAANPSALTNKVFAGVGYAGTLCEKYPSSIGLGGSYEFASTNAEVEQWSVWAKAGISF